MSTWFASKIGLFDFFSLNECTFASPRQTRLRRYMLLQLDWQDSRPEEPVGEAALLAEVRESVALNFGDHGVGVALASLQGARPRSCTSPAATSATRRHCSREVSHTRTGAQ